MTSSWRERYAGTAVLTWSLLIAVLLTLPGGSLPSVELGWLDKLVHALLFAVHCLLLIGLFARRRSGGRTAAAAAGVSALYAAALEALQLAVPGRGWEWWDLFAGGVGIVLTVAVAGWRARLPKPV